MSKEYYRYFIKTWLKKLKNQYQTADLTNKRILKDNIYGNVHFTSKQKDDIWNKIVKE